MKKIMLVPASLNRPVMLTLLLLLAFTAILSAQTEDVIASDRIPRGFINGRIGNRQILFPEAGKSKNLIVPLASVRDASACEAEMKAAFATGKSGRLQKLVAENQYEEALLSAFPDVAFFSFNSLLPENIAARYNRKLDFGGPNCFYTALSAASAIAINEARHVGFSEFSNRLKLFFTEVSENAAKPGDVLLYNSSDHGALYLGADKVFHKKDLNKEYYFRIAARPDVFQPDKGEWVPGPNYCGPFSRPGDTKVRKIQAFRRNQTPLEKWEELTSTLPEYQVIRFIRENVLKTAPAWKLGQVMGYWSETLSEELVRTFDQSLKQSDSGRLLMSELESIRDQIFISIEDSYFSSPYTKPGIVQEIWFYDNDYSRELIRIIRDYYGLATAEDDIARISAALKAVNGEPRGKSLVNIIKN
jgi:hypothetical protein